MILPTASGTIPVVQTLQDCADFSKTVAPYIPQFYELPRQVLANINDFDALKGLYLSTNPLITAFAFAIYVLAPGVLVASEIERNYSEVDRLWSFLPVLYTCHYALWAHLQGLPTKRLDHVMAVTILWGVRLTFNYARRGGYSWGSEDYRWERVKKYLGPYLMFFFNIVFIAFMQSFLLWLITTPTYVLLLTAQVDSASSKSSPALTMADQIFPKLMFLFVLLEYFADGQQYHFQTRKYKYLESKRLPPKSDYTTQQLERGFNTTSLFSYSRHPNFLGEQAFWISLYLYSCFSSSTYVNWTFAAAFSYLCLFQASTWLTELITSEKYPEYKVYQQRVGEFLPNFTTKSMDEKWTEDEARMVKEAQARKDSGEDLIATTMNRALAKLGFGKAQNAKVTGKK